MKTFRVPVEWTMTGYMYIEAKDKDEAQAKAYMEDLPLPPEAEYLDDSFEVWDDMIEEYIPPERTCYCHSLGKVEPCGPNCILVR